MRKTKTVKVRVQMWAIWQEGVGLFAGTYFWRRDAIGTHEARSGIPWRVRRERDGVRCIRVTVSFEVPNV